MSEFSLDREMNLERNVDATGKKWLIHTERGRNLFYTLPEGARSDAVIPPILQGRFTKRMLLQELIKKHVEDSWDYAERVAQKNERKAQVAREYNNAKRQETEEAQATPDTADTDADVSKPDSGDNGKSKAKSKA